MKGLVLPCLAVVAVAASASAHTLDEYVQALRVGVSGSQIAISVDLTAGMRIAADVIARVDTNRDGSVSPLEAEAYGREVLADLAVSLDGNVVPLSLVRVEVPPAAEIREGQAAIRIEAAASGVDRLGPHRLIVHNTHLPSFSAYLANALRPDTTHVRIVRQTRDVRQQTFRLDYETGMAPTHAYGWVLFAGAGLAALVRLRGQPAGADTRVSKVQPR